MQHRIRIVALSFAALAAGFPSGVLPQETAVRSRSPNPDADEAVLPESGLGARGIHNSRNVDTIGVVSAEVSGAFALIAADLDAELGHDGIRIRPLASGGPLRTLEALKQPPAADVGFVQADALESLTPETLPAPGRPGIRTIARIYDEQVHILVPERTTDISQLQGLRVNIDRPGTGSHLTARLVFEKLGIEPTFTSLDNGAALDRLRTGEIDAVFILAPRPAPEVLRFEAAGFRLLAVPWKPDVMKSYNPVDLSASDYPTLIRQDGEVHTIAVGVMLAVSDPPAGSRASERLTRFVRSFHRRLAQLQQPGHHFAWAGIRLPAPANGMGVESTRNGGSDLVPSVLAQGRLKADE